MANIVENTLYVLGEEADRFMEDFGKYGFDIVAPMPKYLLTTKDQKWYSWALHNWGVKWPIDRMTRDLKNKAFKFKTANGSPDRFFEKATYYYKVRLEVSSEDLDAGNSWLEKYEGGKEVW
jgi:hypothetical protein